MLIETLTQKLRKARSVNQTSNGFVAKIPTNTEPKGDSADATGTSVIDLGLGGDYVQNAVLLCFYGTGANNTTSSARAIGWRHLRDVTAQGLQQGLWIPVLLAEFAVTLSATYPGVAGMYVAATELFADTISLTYGNANVSVDVVSPANDAGIAHALLDLKGFQKLELTFTTGGSATDCNAILALL